MFLTFPFLIRKGKKHEINTWGKKHEINKGKEHEINNSSPGLFIRAKWHIALTHRRFCSE